MGIGEVAAYAAQAITSLSALGGAPTEYEDQEVIAFSKLAVLFFWKSVDALPL